jgi:hypothetical protein
MTTIVPRTAVVFPSTLISSAHQVRSYRLVDAQGRPHPVLDDLYDSQDSAWAEAVRWWNSQNQPSRDPIGIGVEVSTSNGDWRTIRYPS